MLAVGGELKNTICLTRGREAFLSQHIGDLENLESYKFFESTVAGLKRILEIEPQILAYDLHPDYFSTRWALAAGRHGAGRRSTSPRPHRKLHGGESSRRAASSASLLTARAMGRTETSGAGKSWFAIIAGSSASPTWITFPCREGPPPSWSLGAWRSATCFTISAGDFWDLDIPFVRAP